MFKKTTSSLDTTGLENKIGPKMEMGPPAFKIPKNPFLFSMEESYNLDSLFTVVFHPEEHSMTPAMDGEDSLQEGRTGSVPSMEEAYNLDSLFTVVCHPEEHNMTPTMDGYSCVYLAIS